MSYFLNKANKRVLDFVSASYTKITVQPGMIRYNHHCHANAVHDAIAFNQPKIAMVIMVDEGYPIVHFINYEPKSKKYVDNTIGYWATTCSYYFVRWIEKPEFNSVFRIHKNMRKHLKLQLPWWLRWLDI